MEGKKSVKEKQTIFKEKEVVLSTGEKILVRRWSAYKFFKLIPHLSKMLEKLTGRKLRDMARKDPKEAFDQLEDLIIGNVLENLTEVLGVAAEEMYEIVKVTLDKDDEGMDEIPFDDMFPLGQAILSVCVTKDVTKKVMALLEGGLRGGKPKKSASEM